MQSLFLLFLPLLCQNAEGARKKRVLNEETEQVQQEPDGPVLEIAEDRKMGERGEVFSSVYDAIDEERNYDAVTGLLEILNSSESNIQKYHGEAQGILINLLSGMNLPYLSLVEQSRALKEDAQTHASFLNTALHNAEFFGSTNMLLDISLPPQSFLTEEDKGHMSYLRGRTALQNGDLRESLEELDTVPANHKDFIKAQNLKGIALSLQEKPGAALVPLQIGLAQFESNSNNKNTEDLQKNKDIIILNVARSYFAMKNYPLAAEFFAKIPRDSIYWSEAQFERAWAHFYMQDMNGSLGLLFTLGTPYFTAEHYPEAQLLRVYSLFMLCKFTEAEKHMAVFEAQYTPHREQLQELRTKSKSDLFFEMASLFTVPSDSGSTTGNKTQDTEELPKDQEEEYIDLRARSIQINTMKDAASGKIKEVTTEVQDTTDSLISKIPQREDWKNETPSSSLPRLLTRHFEHDEWFAGSVRAVAQIENELERISKYPDLQAKYAPILQTQKYSIIEKQGSRIEMKVQQLSNEIEQMLKALQFTRLDITDKRQEQLRMASQTGYMPEVRELANRKQRTARNKHVWPYQGEIWADELGYYKANVIAQCPASMK